MSKVSCIIPAYNEGKRIRNVLGVVSGHPLIDEIIVVDDGSKDNTKEVVGEFKNIRLIVHPINKGKSTALHTGITQSSSEFVFFLDSDLVGLEQKNITDLITPVISNAADVSISLRKNSPKFWHMIGIDYISGERVLSREMIMPYIEMIPKLRPFGFEVFLNRIIIRNHARIAIVQWSNVISPFKKDKAGLWKGMKGDFFMMIDIFRTVTIFGPIYQIIKMMSLKIK